MMGVQKLRPAKGVRYMVNESTGEVSVMESDPNGRDPKQPGAKLDAGKAPVFRGAVDYFPRALEYVAAISAFGAAKYAWKGWETVPEGYERYSDALVRHLTAESKGGPTDSDSGLPHAAHAAWNALARLELYLRDEEQNRLWAASPEANELVERINNDPYLKTSKVTTRDV